MNRSKQLIGFQKRCKRCALLSAVVTSIVIFFSPSAISQTESQQPAFRMLVLGDSVVWGQGLTEEAKFYSIVKRRIEQQLHGRTVHLLNVSHSGAEILPKTGSCPSVPGEVPIGTPSIYSQSDAALSIYASVGVKAEEVDLILLNGGINDMGFPTIVNPFTEEKKIIKRSKKFCFEEMVKLLTSLHQQFPRARLVLTGYYPIISEATDEEFLIKLIRAFFGLPKADEILAKARRKQAEQLKRAVKLNDERLKRSNWLIDRLALLSNRWKTSSDADLEAAVNAVNGAPGRDLPATFVKVQFDPEEAYGARNTNLWRVTGSGGGIGNLETDDEMFSKRKDTCKFVASVLNARAKLICPIAGTGHPNLFGSQKYADAIMQKLNGLLAQDSRR